MKKNISKRYKKLVELSKDKEIETIENAIKKVKENCTTKFNESIDVSFHLNLIRKIEEVKRKYGGTVASAIEYKNQMSMG